MRKRFWIRLGVVLLILVVVLYGAFWAFLFNPLEGSVGDLAAIVPNNVSWYVHGPWREIRNSPVFREHFLESHLRDELDDSLELETYLYEPIREMETRINAQIPGFLGEFSILEDLFGREVVAAGNMTGPGEGLSNRVMNSPWLLLTRISFKAKFMEVLKYEAVQKSIPGLKAYRDLYEYDVGRKAVREGAPESARYFYFQRVKDVLIFSNNRNYVEQAVHFARAGGESDQSLKLEWWYYYDTAGEAPRDSALIWCKVKRADGELGGELSGANEPVADAPSAMGLLAPGLGTGFGDYIRMLFPVGKTISVTLRPGFAEQDRIPLAGVVRLEEKGLPAWLKGLHQTRARPIGETARGWGDYLSAARTFLFVHLHMAPSDFLRGVFATDPGLVGADGGDGSEWDAERRATQLGDWFEDGVTMAQARLPEADGIDLDTWEGGTPKPLPAIVLMLTVKENIDPEQLALFLNRNSKRYGFEPPEERTSANGRLFVLDEPPDAQLGLVKPAYALVGHRFIYCSNVDELVRILGVPQDDEPSLSESGNFRDALAATFPEANFFTFADVERARPALLDRRHQVAFEETAFDQREFRRSVILEITRENPNWTMAQTNTEADRRVDERLHRMKRIDFPDAVRRYRNRMIWYEPFRWFALSDTPGQDQGREIRLDLKGALEFMPSDSGE